ncbi:MAG TPA: Ig-like domain-containing protein, partial [Casimicrobiaceae bacterium]|nr:Ig-like domain-containing protein [Casimicrobiaceae bacterium]
MRLAQAKPRATGAMVRAFITVVALALAAIAGTAAAQTPTPVYRFFNSQTGTHFYTISTAERDFVLARYPQFLYEGPAYFAYPNAQGGNLPVYRFFNTRTGTHFYTQSEAEKNFVLATYPVFAFEGPAYWAPASAGAGNVPLYRFFNSATGAHFFTTNVAERDMVLKTYPSFMYEGVAYQVFPSGGNTPVNQAPVAKLTVSPASVPTVPAIVSLSVTATDADGTVARVEYYLGSDLIGTTYVAPHTMNHPITEPGTYGFRAVAYDNLDMPGSSGTVNVTAASPSANQPPVVSLSVSPESLPAPGQVKLTAAAVDNDGTVAKVAFFDNGSKIGEVTSPPFVLDYNATTAKLYRFSATAWDDKGASSSTPPRAVQVGPGANAAPKVTLSASPESLPAPGAITLTANATDEDGTIAKVAFYANGGKIADVTAAPFKTTYNAPSNAVYKFSAIATDNLGTTATSADVNVSVGQTTNIAPKVSLSVSGTQIPFPGTVSMTATATDDDGTIAKVRFYQNGTQRAEVTAPPYTLSHTTTVPGGHKVNATAH